MKQKKNFNMNQIYYSVQNRCANFEHIIPIYLHSFENTLFERSWRLVTYETFDLSRRHDLAPKIFLPIYLPTYLPHYLPTYLAIFPHITIIKHLFSLWWIALHVRILNYPASSSHSLCHWHFVPTTLQIEAILDTSGHNECQNKENKHYKIMISCHFCIFFTFPIILLTLFSLSLRDLTDSNNNFRKSELKHVKIWK